MNVAGSATLQPLGTLASLSGYFHFDESGGSPHLWGAILVNEDLGSLPALQKLHLVTNETAFLRFNTTSTTQEAPLELNGATTPTNYDLPPDAFSLYIDGSIGIQDVFARDGTLYASFSYATSTPQLDVAFNADLEIGPTANPVLDLNASGVLMLSTSGIAAQLTITLKDSSKLESEGIDLSNSSLGLAFNTFGVDESFTVPVIDGPDGNPMAGTGATYTVTGAPAVSDPPAPGPYLLVTGTADLQITPPGVSPGSNGYSGFDLNGSFDILVTPTPLFRIDIGSPATSTNPAKPMTLTLDVNGSQIITLKASGELLLESTGFAGSLSIDVAAGSAAVSQSGFELDVAFQFEVNTATTPELGIPGQTFMVTGSGDLKVGPSGSQFDLSATLSLQIDPTGLSLSVTNGTAKLGALANISGSGVLDITSDGLYGDVQLAVAVEPLSGFSIAGEFDIEFNTTTSPHMVTVEGQSVNLIPQTFDLHVTKAQLVVASVIDVSGSLDLTIAPTGFYLAASGSLAFMGKDLAVGNVAAAVFTDNGTPELAFYASLGLFAGGPNFTITAHPSVELNTDSSPYLLHSNLPGVPASIPAQTFQVELANAEVDAFGFKATGTIIATVGPDGFDIQVPQSSPLSLGFGGNQIQAYGYLDSSGAFSLTATLKWDDTLDVKAGSLNLAEFELYGSVSVTISSSGFGASFSGGANIALPFLGVGTVNLASVAASIQVSGSSLDLHAYAKLGGLTIGPYDASFGQAPSTPMGTAGLQFYNAPTFAGAGQNITLSASDNDSSGYPIPDADYLWQVYKDGTYFSSSSGSSYDFDLGAPGTYLVNLKSGTGAGYQFSIDPLPSNDTNHTPDVYGVTLTVADPYGGSVTASGSFLGLDPSDVTVNSALDNENYDDGNTYSNITLRYAEEFIFANNLTGAGAIIQFAPSLAGQTIVLTQTQQGPFAPQGVGPGGCFLAIETQQLVIDGSAAPGLTIKGDPSNPHRLFYVNPGSGFLTFKNIKLSGGDATDTTDSHGAEGGALYIDGTTFVTLQNTTIANNEASAKNANPAYGGAVLIGANAELLGFDSTFTGNSAEGQKAYGGAIDSLGEVFLVNCTVAGNSVLGDNGPFDGGGIADAGQASHFDLYNSIVADNTDNTDNGVSDVFVSSGVQAGTVGGSDNIVTSNVGLPASMVFSSSDPMLGQLARRNGALTYSLLPGSPALGKGDVTEAIDYVAPGQIALDQENFPRVVNGKTDIGAVEQQSTIVVTNANASGAGSLAEAVAGDDTGAPITFDSTLAGQTIVLNKPLTLLSSYTINAPSAQFPNGVPVGLSGGGTTEILIVPAYPIYPTNPTANPPLKLTTTITGITFSDGLAASGGAIYNSGNLTLQNLALLNNEAQGGLASAGYGGAIYNANGASLSLHAVTLANNTATGGPGFYFENAAQGRGGAIYEESGSSLTAYQSTFADNTAQGGSGLYGAAGLGGAIDAYGSIAITGSTFGFNAVAYGSNDYGILSYSAGADIALESGGTLGLSNSIAADATGANDIDVLAGGVFQANINNLVMTSSGPNPIVFLSTADPMLRPLGNYGGPTPTLDLTYGSPATGLAYAPYLPATDERGLPRSYQGAGDLGAVQLQHYVVMTTADYSTTQTPVVGSLRWAVANDLDLTPISFNFPSGTYLNLTGGPIVISTNLNIVGPGSSALTIGTGFRTTVFKVSAGSVSISGLTIAQGVGEQGGGVFNAGVLTLDRDYFIQDVAQGDATTGLYGVGAGGAIYNASGGNLTVTNSTFNSNQAVGLAGNFGLNGGAALGGAIANVAGGTLTLSNDTFASNQAIGGDGLSAWFGSVGGIADGGAIDNAGSASVVNVTFQGSSIHEGANGPVASDGSDIRNESGATLTLYNTIAADAVVGHDIINIGTISGGGNLVTLSNLPASLVASTAEPLLTSLQNNGGPTLTFAPTKGSPAVAAGLVSFASQYDQAGNARVVSSRVDIGAIELQVSIISQVSAGGPYMVRAGSSLTLNSSVTGAPAGSTLSYGWSIDGGYFNAASGSSPTLSASQIQSLGVGTHTLEVQVNDGYGGNHIVTSAPITLTVSPVPQVIAVSPSAPGAIDVAFDQVTVTFTTPVSTLNIARAFSLTVNGVQVALPSSVVFTPVSPNSSGQASTFLVTGLKTLPSTQGNYVLTIDATKEGDQFGAGVGTTTISWTLDTTAPTSQVVQLAASQPSTSFVVTATGTDPGLSPSGIASYDVDVSTNGGPFSYWTTVPATKPNAMFTGVGGNSYGFQSFATDAAGNRESKAAAVEAGTYVVPSQAPTTSVTSVNASQQKFVINASGTAVSPNVLDHIDVYVEVDGGSPEPIGKIAGSSGTAYYEAIADGAVHSYAFYSNGVDGLGNVQATSSGQALADVVKASFTASTNVPVGLTVNHGAADRSYVQYADVEFDNASGLASLISGGHLHLVKHALNVANPSNDPNAVTIAPSSYTLSVVDHAIEFNFGAAGLGGNATSTFGDGYYEIDIDGFGQPFFFDRLFGDVNGDGTVDSNDVNLVTQNISISIPGMVVDVEGDGSVTSADRTLTLKARGHAVGPGLHLDA